MTDPKLTDIAVFVRMETTKAWLIYDGSQEVWIPKSQAEINCDNPDDLWDNRKEKTLTLPEWLAKDKGLI